MSEIVPGDADRPSVVADGGNFGVPAEVSFYGEPREPAVEGITDADPGFVISAPADREEEADPQDPWATPPEAVQEGDNGVPASPEPEVPSAGSPGDQDPPTDTPSGEAAEEDSPERGQALSRLYSFVAASSEQLRVAVAEAVTADEFREWDISRLLDEGIGLTRADAIELIGRTRPAPEGDGEQTIQDRVVAHEEALAALQYYPELEAAGLAVERVLDVHPSMTLRMTNPEAFAATLAATPRPEGTGAWEQFHAKTSGLIEDALLRTSTFFTLQHRGVIPEDPDAANREIVDQIASPEQRNLAAQLPQHADIIAGELKRLNGPAAPIAAMRQLGIAHREGLVMEWALGHDAYINGNSDTLIGVDRLSSPHEWEAAYQYLAHLQLVAPNSDFTHDVRENVLRDIRNALDGYDPTLIAPGHVTPGSEGLAFRRRALEASVPLLRQAFERVEQIIPPRR